MRWVKRLGIVVLGLVLIVALAAAGVYGVSNSRMHRNYSDIKVEQVNVPTDAEAPARGQRFVEAIGKCTGCHAANFRGQVMIKDPAFGTYAAANLTRGKGGVGNDYKTDADWVRSIRHGVRPDGRALIFMPSEEYYYLSDRDLGELIAYLKSLPPQDNELPATKPGPVARALYLSHKLPLVPAENINHTGPRPADVAPSADASYGQYIVRVGGCQGCHGQKLEGTDGPPGEPARPNLTPAGHLGKWSEAEFTTALRTGKRPDGTTMNPTAMPWTYTAKMTDDETHAVWSYLKTVPPEPVAKKK